MNWKSLFTIAFAMLLSASMFAQANLLNAKDPSEIGVKTEAQKKADNDGPLPYGYVDDRDILWSATTWEIIDLDERVNFPLYYPIDSVGMRSDRRSLYDVLMKNIKSNKIDKIYVDGNFTETRTLNDIQASLKKVDTLPEGFDQLNRNEKLSDEFVEVRELTAADIEAYHVKGVWYFDKRQGELKYRLLGIAPVSPEAQFVDMDGEQDLIELFWVFYPDAREILHESKAFNDRNAAVPLSFDHLLNSRRFNGIIYKEENVQGDRRVREYVKDNSLMQLLESERIKEKIRGREQDMWNY
ncbi:GldN: gliding motility associated protein GldN [Kordia sp. SMS9]|uniref:type IX secretion system ring protein PorN/GldN n=1 Tax=Kordia sp. SMS9 TaxID=2282170 RepID=UPI000E0D89BB|nr:gliding motility protein GldN [Kordia sp. SMS9]AXG68237.1 GldN: gliding motility associated protein GldN [Kordia sp. SMS9]